MENTNENDSNTLKTTHTEKLEPRGEYTIIGRHGPVEPQDETVRATIPRIGVGFIAGQSGSYKTFLALELAYCLLTGAPFAGRKVERTGAVYYFAFEGEETIEGRFQAIRKRRGDTNPKSVLPFVLFTNLGALKNDYDFQVLDEHIHNFYNGERSAGGDVAAIIIDTVSASGMIPQDSENDPAAWQMVFERFGRISRCYNFPIILVHHYGKSVDAGLRGSSNARAGADFILAATCDRNEITGKSSNHRLALTKSRSAKEGLIAKIDVELVEIGKRSDGSAIETLTLKFDTSEEAINSTRKTSKSVATFRKAFTISFFEMEGLQKLNGSEKMPPNSPVKLSSIKSRFFEIYESDQKDPKKRSDNLRKQFNSAMKNLKSSNEFAFHKTGSETWVSKITEQKATDF